MTPFSNRSKMAVIAALGLAAAFGSGSATAGGRDDIRWSVTIGSNVGVPVYREPVRVYPAPVYVPPAPVYYGGHGYRDPRPAPRPYYTQPTRWDRDGDGIPDRHDRRYNPRWDRDGDGVPNWRDPHPGRGR